MNPPEESKPTPAAAPDDDEELTEEELADISAGTVVPRKVGDTAIVQKKWIHPDESSKKEE